MPWLWICLCKSRTWSFWVPCSSEYSVIVGAVQQWRCVSSSGRAVEPCWSAGADWGLWWMCSEGKSLPCVPPRVCMEKPLWRRNMIGQEHESSQFLLPKSSGNQSWYSRELSEGDVWPLPSNSIAQQLFPLWIPLIAFLNMMGFHLCIAGLLWDVQNAWYFQDMLLLRKDLTLCFQWTAFIQGLCSLAAEVTWFQSMLGSYQAFSGIFSILYSVIVLNKSPGASLNLLCFLFCSIFFHQEWWEFWTKLLTADLSSLPVPQHTARRHCWESSSAMMHLDMQTSSRERGGPFNVAFRKLFFNACE